MQVKAPRGTYDILPPESHKWQHMENVMRETARCFGYQEIRTPLFEHTELFERGVGETTDIVTKEMYTFQDRSQRSLTLRPEGTAPCVRAFIEHSVYGGMMPIKWFYNGPMFRYDRPQTGRYRQFRQFGVEAFGSDSPYLDAEVIFLMVQILAHLGLKDYELHLNSVGCPECRRVYRDKLLSHLLGRKDKLCKDCQARYEKNPLRVLDCKVPSCQEAIIGFPHIYDSLCQHCSSHYTQVREALDDNGVIYYHDHNLVRGLDYYTNTAFEIHIPGIGAQSAVGGGGRYNGLIEACGGPNIPGIGFALGMERLLLAVDSLASSWQQESQVDLFLVVLDEVYEKQGLILLNQLRLSKIRADKDYNHRSVKAQMKYADRIGARIVILIGEDEIKGNYYTIRDMQTKEQLQILPESLVPTIKKLLIK